MAMSMQSAASPAMTFTPTKRNSLTHIPGDEGWPLIGKTFDILADPKGQAQRQAAKYGLVYRSYIFGETNIVLLGPEANELVLFDQTKTFSSTLGWGKILGRLFPRGLMLLDFDEHRLHRRALSVAFKSGPMKSYLAELDTGIAARVAQWKASPGPMLFYPAMKQLTLDLAATSFLGAGIGPEVDEITSAFVDMGGGLNRRDPQAAARYQDGARRQGPPTHRGLFLRTDSDPPRQGRRGPVLAIVPRHP
jgi:cytochrome P450